MPLAEGVQAGTASTPDPAFGQTVGSTVGPTVPLPSPLAGPSSSTARTAATRDRYVLALAPLALRLQGSVAESRPMPPVESGIASWYAVDRKSLAWPEGRGYLLLICGRGGCLARVSTDAGPSLSMQRAGRVVDLNVVDFERICEASRRFGLCHVDVTILGPGGKT